MLRLADRWIMSHYLALVHYRIAISCAKHEKKVVERNNLQSGSQGGCRLQGIGAGGNSKKSGSSPSNDEDTACSTKPTTSHAPLPVVSRTFRWNRQTHITVRILGSG